MKSSYYRQKIHYKFRFKNYVVVFASALEKTIFVVPDVEGWSSFRGKEALELFLNTPENYFVGIFHVVLITELDNLKNKHS